MLMEIKNYQLPYKLTYYEMPMLDRKDFVEKRSKEKNIKTLTPDQIKRLRSLGYVE